MITEEEKKHIKENGERLAKLSETMEKIAQAMDQSDEMQAKINEKDEELHNETRILVVEEGKAEIEDMKNEKVEFDGMTIEALKREQKEILNLREKTEKEFQDKLIKSAKRQREIQEKLSSMLSRDDLTEEKIAMIKQSAQNASDKEKKEMKQFQEDHMNMRETLDNYEKDIQEDAIKLDVLKEIQQIKPDSQKIKNEIDKENQKEEGKTKEDEELKEIDEVEDKDIKEEKEEEEKKDKKDKEDKEEEKENSKDNNEKEEEKEDNKKEQSYESSNLEGLNNENSLDDIFRIEEERLNQDHDRNNIEEAEVVDDNIEEDIALEPNEVIEPEGIENTYTPENIDEAEIVEDDEVIEPIGTEEPLYTPEDIDEAEVVEDEIEEDEILEPDEVIEPEGTEEPHTPDDIEEAEIVEAEEVDTDDPHTPDEPVPDEPTPDENLPIKSGLQIYKQLFVDGPEFKKRYFMGYGRLSRIPVIGQLSGAVGKFFSKGYRNELYEEMKNMPQEDFEMLQDYLTEEEIVRLKVPGPFLDAMDKRAQEIRKTKGAENQALALQYAERANEAEAREQEIEEQIANTPEEDVERREELEREKERYNRIKLENEEEYQKLESKAEKEEDNRQDLDRGKKHRGFYQRGNYEFWGKRNVDNREQIVELAEIEQTMLRGEVSEVEGKRNMRTYMEKNSERKKFLGIPYETGSFYKSSDQLTTIVSDRIENRPELLIYGIIGVTGLVKTFQEIAGNEQLIHELANGIAGHIKLATNPKFLEQQINSITADLNDYNGLVEYINAEQNGWRLSDGTYWQMDAAHHDQIAKMVASCTQKMADLKNQVHTGGTNPFDILKEINNIKINITNSVPAELLSEAIPKHSTIWQGLPQQAQEFIATHGPEGKQALLEVLNTQQEIFENGKFMQILAEKGQNFRGDYSGPMASAIAFGGNLLNQIREAFTSRVKKVKPKDKEEEPERPESETPERDPEEPEPETPERDPAEPEVEEPEIQYDMSDPEEPELEDDDQRMYR